MGRFFSDKTEQGIELVWMQFDFDKIKEGQSLLQQATDEGDAEACSFLARTYFGIGPIQEDWDMAFELLEKSLEMGSSCGLLTMLQFKKLTKKVMKTTDLAQCKKAVDDVQTKAEAGHALCQMIMAMYYFWGGYWVVNEIDANEKYGDEDKAFAARIEAATPWFEKALYSGLAIVLANLYDIYEASPGNEAKTEKAMRFAINDCGDKYWHVRLANWLYEKERFVEALAEFEKLANDGYSRAWYDIGFQYERGVGVEVDTQKAVSSYETGAKLGSRTCQTRLAKLMLWGKLLPKDEAQAYFWFCQAANQGDEVAKMWKGHCLFEGLGVNQDEGEATTLLIDALNYNYPNEGESQAMVEESEFDWKEDMLQMFWDLGLAYESGRGGMPKRDASAGYYFSMVADSGWQEAIEKMTHYKYSGLFKRWKRIK